MFSCPRPFMGLVCLEPNLKETQNTLTQLNFEAHKGLQKSSLNTQILENAFSLYH